MIIAIMCGAILLGSFVHGFKELVKYEDLDIKEMREHRERMNKFL